MDLEMGLNIKDRRNRFQVNRVDSVATGHHEGSNGTSTATLVGFKEYPLSDNGISSVDNSNACSGDDDDDVGYHLSSHHHSSPVKDESISERRSSLSDPNRAKKSFRNTTSFDIPSVAEMMSTGEGLSRCDSPAMLISPTIQMNNLENSTAAAMTTTNNTVTNAGHHNSVSYDTKYAKSFRHFTREALPRLDNYRNMMSIQAAYRPTLDELHQMSLEGKPSTSSDPADSPDPATKGFVKFGWVKGVFVRCLLNIWGVMLFLRLSWCVGHAGIGQAWVIILLATMVTFLTGISMSAISTNGQIKGAHAVLIILSTTVVTFITALGMSAISTNGVLKSGGTYYMISRSLGPEFGASIGLIFAAANAIAVAMYTVGFAEAMVDLLKSLGTFVVENDTNSVRIIGTVAIIAQTGIVIIGMEWEATAQVGLLFILLAAMCDFVIGSFIGPLSDEEYSKGFVGYNGSVFMENLMPAYSTYEKEEQTFFSVFAIFFPAATGILAGANISGDLADPQAAIPKGTLLAILVTTLSYLVFAVIAGATVVREATGNFTAPDWNTTFRNCLKPGDILTDNSTAEVCSWGLYNSFQVMELVSASGGLIYAGCFAATLSSALASLVSAPKVFQALCNDKLYPYLEFFGKGYGQNNEPVRGYVLTFVIALAFILIAELNAIAPLISNFFLAAYALVNLATFHSCVAKPVGWRPTFKYYNMWLSLAGFILCVAVQFLISWVTALITYAVIFCLYMIVIYKKPDVNWGSSTQAQTYKNALVACEKLNSVDEHVKNYRPQILVLSGLPSVRPPLVDFAYLITKHLSLLVCGHVIKGNVNNRVRTALTQKAANWFHAQKIKAFYCVVDDMDFEEGAKALFQAYGIGRLRPSIVLMGYKSNWLTCSRSDLRQYFNTIHKALDMHLSVCVLRVDGGLDFSKKIQFGEEATFASSPNPRMGKSKNNSSESLTRNESFCQISHGSSGDLSPSVESPDKCHLKLDARESAEGSKQSTPPKTSAAIYKNIDGGDIPKDVMDSLQRFQRKYKHGTIDVWWLYDDGGLTLLLPYIISTRSNWSTCKLRVFALANKKDEFDAEQRSMAGLLAKFRIEFSDLTVIPDINKKAQDETRAFFEKNIAGFKVKDSDNETHDSSISITESELTVMRDKTNRHMRLRELLQQHSRAATLIVMTLPMPRKGVVSAPLYMAWLELLTKDMPPFLLVRGNQTSVLTFYS